jgi:hypothetical protein
MEYAIVNKRVDSLPVENGPQAVQTYGAIPGHANKDGHLSQKTQACILKVPVACLKSILRAKSSAGYYFHDGVWQVFEIFLVYLHCKTNGGRGLSVSFR